MHMDTVVAIVGAKGPLVDPSASVTSPVGPPHGNEVSEVRDVATRPPVTSAAKVV